jgi:molecular chaperone DnaK
LAKDNRSIGKFHLDGIPSAPRGVPQIEVKFDIDANGILNVSAKDKGTGKEQKIRIEASSGLTEGEINKMKSEAEANAATDKKERERIDKLNAADSQVFQTEKQLKEFGDKLSEGNKKAIEEALAALKKAYEAQDLAAIDQAIEALNKAWQQSSQEMYQATQQSGATEGTQQPEEGEHKGDDNNDAAEAEYEEVEE